MHNNQEMNPRDEANEAVEANLVCIACPIGCALRVRRDGGTVTVTGNQCKRGDAYGRQEFLAPVRTVTSSVAVTGGERPLVSVKTLRPVPKPGVPAVLAAIRAATVAAPVAIGQVLVADAAGTGVDVVATSDVQAAP